MTEQQTSNLSVPFPVPFPVPLRRRYYLVFDTETTGLMPKSGRGTPSPPISAYPHILQMSFAVYDMFDRKIVSQYDSYVNVSPDIEISVEIFSKLGGETTIYYGSKSKRIIIKKGEHQKVHLNKDDQSKNKTATHQKL